MQLRLVTFKDQNAAIGVALRLMIKHPAFERQPFGIWGRVLAGQARRGHQAFVLDDKDEVRGFFGYAVAPLAEAEAWAAGEGRGEEPDYTEGEALILNAWVSSDKPTRRFMIQAFRRVGLNKTALFYKRFYSDGSVRMARIDNNGFLATHLAYQATSAGTSRASPDRGKTDPSTNA